MKRYFAYVMGLVFTVLAGAAPALAEAAESGAQSTDRGIIAIAAAIAISFAAVAGVFSQAKAISAGLESIGRNPSASGKIFTPMILGLALIESLVILSFVIAINLAGKF